ncbi:anthranilate synthase component I family protein [Desertivirga brevis]|uniref:anthranilate synthase component I family protein n=1 Tax=Desertivirga brevis TaxID=2810310 RepID=UPI001A9741D1|nr:anthranilate synthase component I family protein [Pedobacter sp. SYSU D00873]
MRELEFQSDSLKILGDTLTPVDLYLRVRDEFANSIILESSNYHNNHNSYSYICFDPISRFEVIDEEIHVTYPGEDSITTPIIEAKQVLEELNKYIKSFTYSAPKTPFTTNGLFGFTSYNAVRYFEEVEINSFENEARKIPDLLYQVFKYVVVYSHHNEEVWLFEHKLNNKESRLEEISSLIQRKKYAGYSFKAVDKETSNFTDQEFLDIVQKGKDHCFRGDVFQIVLSRRFSRAFTGDDFTVYRALRHINPSPYLFFFDLGDYRIFGSSPEAQIVVKDGSATIFPIAGTVKRTGDEEQDEALTQLLIDDPKENAEHVMLVDLARNDLSSYGTDVEVETYKEVQYYSHVIHLVSKVTGRLDDRENALHILARTFPAGTLSGAPKHKALQLINRYEKQCRGYYGGAIGYIGFDGRIDHAIMIRTILSKGNKLFYQAGAGVVAKSKIENELQEVNNKLAALKRAIQLAETI